MFNKDPLKISVLGLGYVGLPLAVLLAEKFNVIGFDISQNRIDRLKAPKNIDSRITSEQNQNSNIEFTANPKDLGLSNIYIICVPTDIDLDKTPDLNPLKSASKIVGEILKKGDIVIYESTVYPGCTEEDCLPILEKYSDLKVNEDFTLGYSPERVVPGSDEKHFKDIVKIVAASNEDGLERIASLYQSILVEEIYKAPSIKVAEAAKVLENTQRYINISLMNEMAMLFNKMNIETQEVIKAASTKWNFNSYYPGLVGGHCISIDPFYLLHKAGQLGMESPFIQAGSDINDKIPRFISQSLIRLLNELGKFPQSCKVLVMGVTFKENINDIRNSKVFDLISALNENFGLVEVSDPKADAALVENEYGVSIQTTFRNDYDAVIVSVAHQEYLNLDESFFLDLMNQTSPILMDIKHIYQPSEKMIYWSL